MAEPTPVTVTVCPDGPLLVRGPVEILDENGRPVPLRRSTLALCRCGRSTIAPFRESTHKLRGGPSRSGP